MEGLREGFEYLVGLGQKENVLVPTEIGLYSKDQLYRVKEVRAAALTISTLTGLVDYVKTNLDKLPEKLLIHVESHKEVALYSPLNNDRDREQYIRAEAILPNNIVYNRFSDTEDFNIMLQASFVDNEDKEKLLKYTGLIRDENVQETGDDGVSQAVVIKTGVASVGKAVVPNPVILAPYRTFPEVAQPESKFIFRMQSGPRAAIFEADGGAWRNEAIKNIKDYLQEQLKEFSFVEIIA
jgi:hypothetical protein